MTQRRLAYLTWFVVALAIHAAILLATTSSLFTDASYDIASTPSVDVELVESNAEPLTAEVVPPAPPDPEPPPVTPLPPPEPMKLPEPPPPVETPVPEPPKPEPPKPEPPKPEPPKPEPIVEPTPKPTPKPEPPKPQAKPRAAAIVPRASSAPATTANAGTSGSSNNVHPSYLFNPPPPYPAESRAAREQGLVLLSVSVNEQGHVSSLSIKQSSGFPRLDNAARIAVTRWKFKPARMAGVALATVIDVPVRFRLGQQ